MPHESTQRIGAYLEDLPRPTPPRGDLEVLPQPTPPEKDLVAIGFERFSIQIEEAILEVEDLGYEVSTFCTQWSLPPKAKLRFVSNASADPARLAAASDKYKNRYFGRGAELIISAIEARKVQSATGMAAVVLDVEAEYATPPKIRMFLLKDRREANADGDHPVRDIASACPSSLHGK